LTSWLGEKFQASFFEARLFAARKFSPIQLCRSRYGLLRREQASCPDSQFRSGLDDTARWQDESKRKTYQYNR